MIIDSLLKMIITKTFLNRIIITKTFILTLDTAILNCWNSKETASKEMKS